MQRKNGMIGFGCAVLAAAIACTTWVSYASAQKDEKLFMTVIEAKVPADKVAEVPKAFAPDKFGELPAGVISSWLQQDPKDPTVWRYQSLWKNKEMLETYRKSTKSPKGPAAMTALGAKFEVKMFDVVMQRP
jgi:hypothetical protein